MQRVDIKTETIACGSLNANRYAEICGACSLLRGFCQGHGLAKALRLQFDVARCKQAMANRNTCRACFNNRLAIAYVDTANGDDWRTQLCRIIQ